MLPSTGNKIMISLAQFLCQSQPPDISEEKKEWFKKPEEAKAAEGVGAWFAFLLAGEIALFITMDFKLIQKQGKRGYRSVNRWWGMRKVRDEVEELHTSA